MRLSSLAVVAFIAGASSPTYVSKALAAPECSRSMELADWGENSTADINVASGESCTFPIPLPGAASSAQILQRPAQRQLKTLIVAIYECKGGGRFNGRLPFATNGTGKGPR